MSSVKEQINTSHMKARLSKDKVATSILSLIKGEIETIEKRTQQEMNESEVIAILKKLMDSCRSTNDLEEMAMIDSFIPKQLDSHQICKLIAENGPFNHKGDVFAFMKKNYPGEYDGNVVRVIVEEMFK